MHFLKIGDYLAVSRITGPKHNLLLVRLGGSGDAPPVCERLHTRRACTHEPLDEERLIQHVLNGVAGANQELGTNYDASHIRYVVGDTQPEDVYGHLAYGLIERFHHGGDFVPGAAAGP